MYVRGTILDTGDITVNETNKSPVFRGLTFWQRKTDRT